ncbi:hypothetical protein LguiA_013998 [Lonicera macranthoides]
MPNRKERQFSWLLQALDNNIEASHSLFNPIDNKFYLLDFPEAQGKVATVEDTHSGSPTVMYLINPLTRARIKLPSRNKFPNVKRYRANKVDKEYSIFAFEEGDHEAFDFLSSNEMNLSHTYKHIGVGPNLNVTEIATDFVGTEAFTRHLVKCSDGGLIMVERDFHHIRCIRSEPTPTPTTSCFRVYKLDSINSSWVEVKTIGDDILFLGLNASFSISFHPFSGYKRNQIYFTDSNSRFLGEHSKEDDADIGVFNLEDGTLRSIPSLKCNSKLSCPPPIWVNMG